jgi:hypothetical protein
MSDIIYPTLDLFLYDLRDGLGENAGEIADNQAAFAQKLPERIRSLIVQRDATVEAEYVELLGHTKKLLKKPLSLTLTGSVCLPTAAKFCGLTVRVNILERN